MKNRNKNIPSHKAYKKAKKEHKKDFLRLHHLSVKCFVAETNKQKPKNDTKDQNENGRLDFIEEGSWGGLRIPRHIWTHFTSIVTLITTTFRRGRVIFVAMETFMSKELHFISKVSHYFSKDIVLLFELISLLFEPISLRFLCFVTLRNEIFRKGILLQMARHTKTVYEQSSSTSDPKRSWSVKIDKIENVTVKKTFTGTDQRTWNRVKLRYIGWPVPVFIRFIEISRI